MRIKRCEKKEKRGHFKVFVSNVEVITFFFVRVLRDTIGNGGIPHLRSQANKNNLGYGASHKRP